MEDSAKIRLIHGGVKETHVFHLHNHQWRLEPEDPKSTIIDSISIFHCHLYPHFHEGRRCGGSLTGFRPAPGSIPMGRPSRC